MVKRAFYISVPLADAWEKWHYPSKKDYSPNAAAALLLWMELPAALRGELRKLATSPDVAASRKKARDLLSNAVVDQQLQAFYDSLGPEGKAKMLEDARRSEQKLRDKK